MRICAAPFSSESRSIHPTSVRSYSRSIFKINSKAYTISMTSIHYNEPEMCLQSDQGAG